MELSDRQAQVHRALAASGSTMTGRQILEALGEEVDNRSLDKVRRVLARMVATGAATRLSPGIYTAGNVEVSAATPSRAPAPVAAKVPTPWGDAMSGEEARELVSAAVGERLGQLKRSKRPDAFDEAIRLSFAHALDLSAKLPAFSSRPVTAPPPEQPTEDESECRLVRLPLPEGMTYDEFSRRTKAALAKGALSVGAVSSALGGKYGPDFCERILRGQFEPPTDVLEQIYAVTYRKL